MPDAWLNVALYQPEIPPNTGNIMRLCANSGARLHLIHPMGFSLDNAKVKRAGLDYRDLATVTEHESLDDFLAAVQPTRVLACTTAGSTHHTDWTFAPGDTLLLGPETRGLPAEVLATIPREQWLRIPLRPGNRSLNLSNAAAILVYEAWRQQGFAGGH